MSEVIALVPEFTHQPVEILRAVPEDAEAICDIRDRAWLAAYPNTELGITSENIRLNAKGRDDEFVPRRIAYLREQFANEAGTGTATLVAKADGSIVGFIDPRIDERGQRRIGALYVVPEAQGMGVGSKLIRKVLDQYGSDQDISLEVVSYNQNAIDFYKRFGFEVTDSVVPEETNRPDYITALPQIEMVLRAQNGVESPHQELIATSKNGIVVTYDPIGSNAATHLDDTLQLKALVNEVVGHLELDGQPVAKHVDMGRIVGTCDVVTVDDTDEIVYGQRKNRARQGLVPFTKTRPAEPCQNVAVCLNPQADGTYNLASAWIGTFGDDEPFPTSPDATDNSAAYWSRHAFVYGSQEIAEGTETATRPW